MGKQSYNCDVRISYGMDYKDICLVECDTVKFGGHILMFQWHLLHLSSTLTMKAASASEMSVFFYQTT